MVSLGVDNLTTVKYDYEKYQHQIRAIEISNLSFLLWFNFISIVLHSSILQMTLTFVKMVYWKKVTANNEWHKIVQGHNNAFWVAKNPWLNTDDMAKIWDHMAQKYQYFVSCFERVAVYMFPFGCVCGSQIKYWHILDIWWLSWAILTSSWAVLS